MANSSLAMTGPVQPSNVRTAIKAADVNRALRRCISGTSLSPVATDQRLRPITGGSVAKRSFLENVENGVFGGGFVENRYLPLDGTVGLSDSPSSADAS